MAGVASRLSDAGVPVKVLINGRYAYETALNEVEVGDEMVLPGRFSGPWTGIGETFSKPCDPSL